MVQYSTKSLTSFTKFWLHTNERSEVWKQQQSSVEWPPQVPEIKNQRQSTNVSNLSIEEESVSNDMKIDEEEFDNFIQVQDDLFIQDL